MVKGILDACKKNHPVRNMEKHFRFKYWHNEHSPRVLWFPPMATFTLNSRPGQHVSYPHLFLLLLHVVTAMFFLTLIYYSCYTILQSILFLHLFLENSFFLLFLSGKFSKHECDTERCRACYCVILMLLSRITFDLFAVRKDTFISAFLFVLSPIVKILSVWSCMFNNASIFYNRFLGGACHSCDWTKAKLHLSQVIVWSDNQPITNPQFRALPVRQQHFDFKS